MTQEPQTLLGALELTSELVPEATADHESAWAEAALGSPGPARIGPPPIPAAQAVQLVLGTALVSNQSLAHVAQHLQLEVPTAANAANAANAATPAGPAPAKELFQRTASQWAQRSAASDRWHGLALYAFDS